MSMLVPCLKVTVDVDVPSEGETFIDTVEEPKPLYCSCESEYCDCGSTLGVTKASAQKVYKHLGFPNGRDDLVSQDYRPCALHIWGTHNLSTDDVLSWLSDYSPNNIEWINDASCNIVFADENTVLRAIVDFAEPFDRRVALAAAAALASLYNQPVKDNNNNNNSNNSDDDDDDDNDNDNKEEILSTDQNIIQSNKIFSENKTIKKSKSLSVSKSLTLSNEALQSIEQFSQYLPPTGRWYKALSVPSQTISLFLRFAHKSDVKLPGAERRSLYYRRFGNPNYGGMTGILTRSYRRRLRTTRKKTGTTVNDDSRFIQILPSNFAELVADVYDDPDAMESSECGHQSKLNNFNLWNITASRSAPERSLIVYDNLYDDPDIVRQPNHPIKNYAGQRRNASEFPVPKSPRQPRKWPRRDRGPPPNRWLEEDLFEPPEPGSIVILNPREPWGDEITGDRKPFVFTGNRNGNNHHNNNNNRKFNYRTNFRNMTTTTVTLMPDSDFDQDNLNSVESDSTSHTRRLLASMTMVADLEEQTPKNRSITDRLGFSTNRTNSYPEKIVSRLNKHRKGSVWQRLG